MWLETKTFSSKISRRIFATFVTCALLPVGCVAILAYFKVTRHLEVQALESLYHAVKSQAMTLDDRLHMAADELRFIGSVIKNQKQIIPDDLDALLRDRLQERFNSITLFNHPNEPQPFLNQQIIPPLQITSDDIIRFSQKLKVVRDGVASFYYHPHLGTDELSKIIPGLQDAGYTFVRATSLME